MAAFLETIDKELSFIAAGLAQATTMVGEAEAYLRRSIDAGMRGGFAAMAANLHGAQQQLRQIHTTLNTATATLAHTRALVAAAPSEIDAGQAQSLLTPLPVYIDQVREKITQVLAQVPPVTARIAASASRNPSTAILTALGQQVLGPARQRTTTVSEVIAAALAEAGIAQAGEYATSNGPSAGRSPAIVDSAALAPVSPPAPAREPPRQSLTTQRVPVTPGWQHPNEIPEHVRSVGATVRPRTADDRRFTVAVLDGERVHSGGDDTSIAADLVSPRAVPPVTFWQHAESKVAARMRRETRQRAEVIIDNTPCGSVAEEQNYVWGCDQILPSILPAGSRLVVWVTCDGGQTFYRRTYCGTGERIRR